MLIVVIYIIGKPLGKYGILTLMNAFLYHLRAKQRGILACMLVALEHKNTVVCLPPSSMLIPAITFNISQV